MLVCRLRKPFEELCCHAAEHGKQHSTLHMLENGIAKYHTFAVVDSNIPFQRNLQMMPCTCLVASRAR